MAIVIRKARFADRKEVLRICKTTWGGWDYVPLYFTQWVKEKGFYVMEDGKRIVGLAKYTELAPRELWLEGLRVDPECRSHGLGWKLSRFMLRAALAEKPLSLRLATGRRNRHSRTLIRRMGLRLKLALWGYDGRISRIKNPELTRRVILSGAKDLARNRPPGVFVPDPQAAFNYIRTTEEYRASKHLLQHTWQFRTINLELMSDLARQKRIFACGDNTNIRGLLIIQPGRYESGRLDLSFIEGDRKALGAFRKEIRLFARKNKAKSIAGMARGESMLRHMRGLRMRRWRRPGKLPTTLVYEYPIGNQKSELIGKKSGPPDF
jgi:GNAT superfamily N-acetyltransferase